MNMNFESIAEKIIQFRNDRDWAQYHDPKNLSQAIGIEAAELQEIFLWIPIPGASKSARCQLSVVR